MKRSFVWLFGILLLSTTLSGAAEAGVLTQDAINSGFGLTTFVSGFHQRFDVGNVGSGGVGPLGIAFVGNGVMISDADGYIRSLPTRADGQIIAPPVNGSTPFYGFVGAMGLAELNGHYYTGGYFQNPGLLEITSTGTYFSNISHNQIRSLAVDPLHNVLYAAGTGLFRYDPTLNTYTDLGLQIPDLNTEIDGITTDGKILYVTSSFTGNDWESIRGYRLSDGKQVFDSGRIDGVDGTVLGRGSLEGKIYANTNFGELYEIDLMNPLTHRLIMKDGTRGDFVTVDPYNGTLLITQSTEILRLTAPVGGSFSNVPEPSTFSVFGMIAICALTYRKRNSRSIGDKR